ncbi:EamA family transporter [soil metagenome]
MSARTNLGPVGLVLVGIISVQFGAGIAKNLFDQASPTTIVWLRLATAAVLLMALVRPRLGGRSGQDWLVVCGYGASLAIMNWSFYQALGTVALGLAVTIEFLGPLSVAVLGSRRARDLVWAGLAGAGVLLLSTERTGIDARGLMFVIIAAVCWALYILLSQNTGARWEGLDGLAVACVISTIIITPLLVGIGPGDNHVSDLGSISLVLAGIAVGVLSSVIPYSCELVALRSLAPGVFGILMSMEPAAAALAGMVVVGEHLLGVQWVAMACVVAASIGATMGSRTPDEIPGPLG